MSLNPRDIAVAMLIAHEGTPGGSIVHTNPQHQVAHIEKTLRLAQLIARTIEHDCAGGQAEEHTRRVTDALEGLVLP